MSVRGRFFEISHFKVKKFHSKREFSIDRPPLALVKNVSIFSYKMQTLQVETLYVQSLGWVSIIVPWKCTSPKKRLIRSFLWLVVWNPFQENSPGNIFNLIEVYSALQVVRKWYRKSASLGFYTPEELHEMDQHVGLACPWPTSCGHAFV